LAYILTLKTSSLVMQAVLRAAERESTTTTVSVPAPSASEEERQEAERENEEAKRVQREAIAELLQRCEAVEDTLHKYDAAALAAKAAQQEKENLWEYVGKLDLYTRHTDF
jgi:hypothetical protein